MNDEGAGVVIVLESAVKHGFTEEQIKAAWESSDGTWVRVREGKLPPHYMAIGFIGNKEVEMIAFSTGFDYYVFHANSPLSASFKKEYRENGGRL